MSAPEAKVLNLDTWLNALITPPPDDVIQSWVDVADREEFRRVRLFHKDGVLTTDDPKVSVVYESDEKRLVFMCDGNRTEWYPLGR
jgi:hypothetical protein